MPRSSVRCPVIRPSRYQRLMPSGVGLPLTSIGILDGKAHGSAAHSRVSRKDATFVMAPVIAVQHDTARRPTSHDDDFVLEHDRQAQSIDIEGPCFCQTRNKEDQALEVLGSHAVNPAKRGKRSLQRH